MKVLNHILSTIESDAPVTDIVRGIYWTAVVSKFCGLSSTMLRDHTHDHADTGPLSLTGKTAAELARLCLSDDIGKASLGLAAINSLTPVDLSRCTEVNAGDILVDKSKGKDVTIVGHFPFVDKVRMAAKNLWVIEKWQKPGDYPEEDASLYLPRSDIVAITGATLINHTLEYLLELCPKTSFIMVLGPTTPLTDVLFEYGVAMISGSMVIDQQLTVTMIKQGANFRQIKRSGAIRLLVMTR